MRFVLRTLVLFALLLSALPSGLAAAHELILVPQFWHAYATGQKVPFSIISSHVFMKSEELEDAANVEASYAGMPLALTANQAFDAYDGVVELRGSGAAILTGHRKGQVWSRTTEGMKQGGRTELGDAVIEARMYEKFAKALLPVDGDSTGFDATLGHTLEIVPVDDPLTARTGDVVSFRVLLDGEPSGGEVFATYDGFSDASNTYAFYAEAGDDGIARVRLSAPGLWMVRAQRVKDVQGQDHDKHYLRAVTAFPVR